MDFRAKGIPGGDISGHRGPEVRVLFDLFEEH